MNEAEHTQFQVLSTEFELVVQVWKEEWLRVSQPRDFLEYLVDPTECQQKRLEDWEEYFIPRAITWWSERGWKIRFDPTTLQDPKALT